jgi:hypothetical protein
VRNRTTARIVTLALGAAVPVLTAASPAVALHRDDGSVPGPSLGAGLVILYFVVIPVGAFLVIAGLSLLPSALTRPRYRPGKPWEFGARWFGGPAEGASEGDSGSSARGGASAEW